MVELSVDRKKSLTLLELFLIIFVLATTAFISLIVFSPYDPLADVRDAQRTEDITTIITAIHQRTVDTGNSLPAGLTLGMQEKQLGTCFDSGMSACPKAQDVCIDLASELASYLAVLPRDPSFEKTASTSGYSVTISEKGEIIVAACKAEKSELSVTR